MSIKALSLPVLVVVWGSYYIANKLALSMFGVVFNGVFIRTFVLFSMLLVGTFTGKIKEILRVGYIFPRLVLIGLLGFALDITAFLGFKYSTASKGAVLLRTDVLFSTVISIFLGELPSFVDILSMVLMLFGVVLVSGSTDLIKFSYGDIFFLLSAFFISLNAFVIRSVQEDKRNPGSDFVIAFYNNFFTLVFFCLFSINSLVRELTRNFTLLGANIETAGLVMGGIFQYLIYVVYYRNLRIFPVWLVRTVLLLMPAYVIFVMSFFGESVTAKQLVGVLVILFGGFLLTMSNYFSKGREKR
ncbi:EamA-like transporter family protein [Fervidobacterium changbaicum]|uniref:EamA/RhaT family transporter n=1 Tax=Fervidobacterium changbaicum TaxID=310769 RepID=A0ABX5QR26_9BACT|nr:EamA/RhaT family transporter [Fervidobacterium changbaicum]SDH48066.1 EamA-like transporter family protein [Fervidobacterium changbaicum]